MSSKSLPELQKFINDSLISLIERNEHFAPWVNSNQYQLDVTIHFSYLPHYQQIGPTCGLTALLMIKDYYNKLQETELLNIINKNKNKNHNDDFQNQKEFSERLKDILNIAIKKKFTNKGEMFWSKGMALLIKNYCGLKCKVLRFQDNVQENDLSHHSYENINNNKKMSDDTSNKNYSKKSNSFYKNSKYNISEMDHQKNSYHKISQTITRNLLKNNLCLISYDKDGNNEPCFKNGHKAHWCIINGFIFVEPVKKEQNSNDGDIQESMESSKYNIIWNDTEKSERVIPQLKNHLSNLYFICTHSSSRYPGLFKAEQLLKSNSQLNEVAPSVIKETKEYLFHDLKVEESKNPNLYTNIILKTLSSSNKSPLLNGIPKDRPSLPIPPPPIMAKSENSFVNNSLSNRLSDSKFSFINGNNSNSGQKNVAFHSCQGTQAQKDRRGYIIPNFYSFPKKNQYNWEQYQASLRKDFLRNKKSIPMDQNSNYNGHSLKETLSSSVILVGKQGFYNFS